VAFNESLSKQEMLECELQLIVTAEHLLEAVQVLVFVSVCIFCGNLFLVKAIWDLGHTETLLSHLLKKKH
jgi:hypothetical protein